MSTLPDSFEDTGPLALGSASFLYLAGILIILAVATAVLASLMGLVFGGTLAGQYTGSDVIMDSILGGVFVAFVYGVANGVAIVLSAHFVDVGFEATYGGEVLATSSVTPDGIWLALYLVPPAILVVAGMGAGRHAPITRALPRLIAGYLATATVITLGAMWLFNLLVGRAIPAWLLSSLFSTDVYLDLLQANVRFSIGLRIDNVLSSLLLVGVVYPAVFGGLGILVERRVLAGTPATSETTLEDGQQTAIGTGSTDEAAAGDEAPPDHVQQSHLLGDIVSVGELELSVVKYTRKDSLVRADTSTEIRPDDDEQFLLVRVWMENTSDVPRPHPAGRDITLEYDGETVTPTSYAGIPAFEFEDGIYSVHQPASLDIDEQPELDPGEAFDERVLFRVPTDADLGATRVVLSVPEPLDDGRDAIRWRLR